LNEARRKKSMVVSFESPRTGMKRLLDRAERSTVVGRSGGLSLAKLEEKEKLVKKDRIRKSNELGIN